MYGGCVLLDHGLLNTYEAIEEITEQNDATDPPLPSDDPSIKEQPFHLGHHLSETTP